MHLHPQTLPVLRLLSDGSTRTAHELSAAGDGSREDVLAACDQLSALGVELLCDPAGDAFRLSAPVQLLEAARINALLDEPRPVVHVREQCDSTNDALRALALAGAPSGTSLTCEVQSSGRGRLGRSWIAPPGTSIALSVLWRFPLEVGALAGLSLAVAVGAVQALDRVGIRDVVIKWPNDLLYRDAKVGGILIDTLTIAGGCAAIIGIGINLRLGLAARALIESLPREGAALACAGLHEVSSSGADRNVLIAALVNDVQHACELFSRAGFEPFRARWLARHAFQSVPITIIAGTQPRVAGRAVDIAADGALIVETAQGRQTIYAGEVSVRP